MNIRDRIKELRRVRAADLRPNPRNWRTHPAAQQDALRGLLAEIGYADALLVRELADGTLLLIDGHLRAETTPDAVVPVLVLDVDEREADKILLTLDPLAGLATTSHEQLRSLLAEVETESSAVQALIDEIGREYGNADDVATAAATYRVMLGDDTPLDHNHRLVDSGGAVYGLTEYSQADRIDTLPVATARKLMIP